MVRRNCKYARSGPVMAQIVITSAQNFFSPVVTYRNKAHWFFMLVSERICTYQFVKIVYKDRDNRVRLQWNCDLDHNNPARGNDGIVDDGIVLMDV